jgi:hypothetical protein
MFEKRLKGVRIFARSTIENDTMSWQPSFWTNKLVFWIADLIRTVHNMFYNVYMYGLHCIYL